MRYSTYVEQQLENTYKNRESHIEEDKKKSLGRYSIENHSKIATYDDQKAYFEQFWGYSKAGKTFF